MKSIILSLVTVLYISLGAFAQNVNIPDANFKTYLLGVSAINTNADSEIQVSEAAAYTGIINCQSMNILDLTGIEAFTAVTDLKCSNNPLGTIDVSQNTALTVFWVHNCSLTSLDISQNSALTTLVAFNNNLTSLDVSQNIGLVTLSCSKNSIDSLDIRTNTSLVNFICDTNNLNYLNMKNIDTNTLTNFKAYGNPSLTCIEVDDVTEANAAWTNIDLTTSFGLNCSATTDIKREENLAKFSIYPNPSSNAITIEGIHINQEYQIINVLGDIVQYGIASKSNLIHIESLINGLYFIRLNKSNTLKFIKE